VVVEGLWRGQREQEGVRFEGRKRKEDVNLIKQVLETRERLFFCWKDLWQSRTGSGLFLLTRSDTARYHDKHTGATAITFYGTDSICFIRISPVCVHLALCTLLRAVLVNTAALPDHSLAHESPKPMPDRRNTSSPDLLCSGRVGLNFLLHDSGSVWSLISQMFVKMRQTVTQIFNVIAAECSSLTCWLQGLKSSACPATIPSAIIRWGLSLATLTRLISALHQCPVCLPAIGQSPPHGMLISLTSSIDRHCETA